MRAKGICRGRFVVSFYSNDWIPSIQRVTLGKINGIKTGKAGGIAQALFAMFMFKTLYVAGIHGRRIPNEKKERGA